MTLQKTDLKKGERYTHDQIKHLLDNKYKDRKEANYVEVIDQVDDESLKNFREIARIIKEKVPNSIVCAWGSRTARNHLPDSDYDIIVYADKKYWDEIQKLSFSVKVGFNFIRIGGFVI